MGTTDKTSQTTQANSTKPNGLIYGLNDRPPLARNCLCRIATLVGYLCSHYYSPAHYRQRHTIRSRDNKFLG